MVLHHTGETGQIVRRDFRRLFGSLGVAEIGFGLPTEMTKDYWLDHGKIPGFVCRDPYNRMFVYWDGLIGPCCGEWERGLVMGDANHDPLAQVWKNERYQALRRAHEENRYETVAICRKCSVPWLSIQEVEA
jgi:radical SAM protein with 4Fe4S-binding SPASM domain